MCIFLSLSPFIYFVLYAFGWFSGGVCKSKRRLDGKIVVITGGDSGIGFETSLDLAKRGAHIIMGCLNEARGEKAAQSIRLISKQPVDVISLNLAKFASVRIFAAKVEKLTPKIDLLVNNAGGECSKVLII